MGLSRNISPRLAPMGSLFDIPLGSVNEPNASPLTNVNVPYPGTAPAPESGGWPAFSSIVSTGVSSMFDTLFPGVPALVSLFSGGPSAANPTDSTSSGSYPAYPQPSAGGVGNSYGNTYNNSTSAYTGQSSTAAPATSSLSSWILPAIIGGGVLILLTGHHHHSRR